MKTLADPRIGQFADLVRAGLESWIRAGRLLCQIKADDPGAIAAILEANPELTPEILASFERIGRREVHPALVLDGSPGAKRLAALPYDEQARLHRAEVLVVVRSASGPVTRHKRVCDLTKSEALRVIGEQGIRTEAEQRRLLRPRRGESGTVERMRREEEPDSPVIDVEAVAVEAGERDPRQQFKRLVDGANAQLLEARSALVMIHRADSPHDRHIADALRAVGELRFLFNEGEI